ncbi:hypothetical protein CC85DRAFT_286059 [Cutaneotrichosporon oleaginosum]|uniref:Ribonuclease H n=1 Tax=Cutaneotrichosporon oleaginosum TaxID=879819 RepID=A0A0J1B2J7_9TREE|nr:uncharacterized protein CC85DRAFT_286059 [Cutaneotrichosporon oleaginosum]KLT41824.1 hypothetical protein CC85DRAFT_286059 [Cutaneotrichosporon oleaginosum]
MPKAGYYAVAVGRTPGIYGTWAECQAQVTGFRAAQFKKFGSQREAEEFVRRHRAIKSDAAVPLAGTSSGGMVLPSRAQSKPDRVPAKNKGRTRGNSPIAEYAAADTLPERFAKLAAQGFMFTATSPPRLVVYTDGSGLSNGTRRACAGAGVYWGDGEAAQHNIAERVPGKLQTNNRGELLSIILALENCPFPDIDLEVRTDSQYSIMSMTVFLPTWIKNGWRTQAGPVKNVDMIRHLLVLMRRRQAPMRFKHVRGHSGHAGNDRADELARSGAAMPPLPDRRTWLDPDDEPVDHKSATDVAADIDPAWLMSEAEMEEYERSLAEEQSESRQEA